MILRQTVGAKTRFPSPSALFKAVRRSKLPPGGIWTHENFTERDFKRLTADTIQVRRAAILKGSRALSVPLAELMRGQIKRVIERVERQVNTSFGSRGGLSLQTLQIKAAVRIPASQHTGLWADALNYVFGEDADIEVVRTVRSPMQAVADGIAEKVSTLVGGSLSSAARHTLHTQTDEIANQVTRINDTTRERLRHAITEGISAGESPFEVMERVRKRVPQIATNRVPTIVRTEMGRVADAATLRAMKDSGVVTHVSVTGCEAIEPGIPTFRGVPTCNIKNVPIAYSGDLHFHINHTGAIIASGFKTQSGHTPDLPLRGGQGVGTWEDRGRPVPAVVNEKPPGAPAGGAPPKPLPPPAPPPAPPKPPAPPRDAAGFPVSLDNFAQEFEDLGSAGGSTGARFMRDKHTGVKYVVKKMEGAGGVARLTEEDLADRIYRKAGVGVPETKLLTVEGKAVKFSRFLDEGQSMRAFLDANPSGPVREAMLAEARKGFAMDAWLANWDAAGLDLDNMLVVKGKVYRIDAGGALRYRAQGGLKGVAFTEDGVPELWSLRNQARTPFSGDINAAAQAVFGGEDAYSVARTAGAMEYETLLDEVQDAELKRTLRKRAAAMLEYHNRALHYQHHGIKSTFFDDTSYEMEVMRQEGILDKLPKKLKPLSATSTQYMMLDENGKAFDGLRDQNGLIVAMRDYAAKRAGLTPSLAETVGTEWADSQASDSWMEHAVRYKTWLAEKKYTSSVSSDTFDYRNRVRESEGWRKTVENLSEAGSDIDAARAHQALLAYHTFAQVLLERTELHLVDSTRKAVRLIRTESEDAMAAFGRPSAGTTLASPKKGLNESHAPYRVVEVKGEHITEQAVPLCRINGHYLVGRNQGGYYDSFFAGDGENEFSATCQGVPLKYHGGNPALKRQMTSDIGHIGDTVGDWTAPDSHLLPEKVDAEFVKRRASLLAP